MFVLKMNFNETILVEGNVGVLVAEISKNSVEAGFAVSNRAKNSSEDVTTKKSDSMAVMDEIAEILVKIISNPHSKRQVHKTMEKIKQLMCNYTDLKAAENKSECYGRCKEGGGNG